MYRNLFAQLYDNKRTCDSRIFNNKMCVGREWGIEIKPVDIIFVSNKKNAYSTLFFFSSLNNEKQKTAPFGFH